MRITESQESIDAIKEDVDNWSDVDFVDRGTDFAFGIEQGGWGVEVLVQDGWAYVHGYNSLSEYSTNVENVEDVKYAIEKFLSFIK